MRRSIFATRGGWLNGERGRSAEEDKQKVCPLAAYLIMDGAWRGLRPASLADPNIDIVSNHYYPDGYAEFVAACNGDRSMAKGKKVFVVGEFGLTATSHLKDFLDTVINNGTSGALLWAFRPHKKDGGFHHHQERGEYKDYHWPGFASGKAYDEIVVLDLIRNNAFKIRGLPVPARAVPDAPFLLPAKSPQALAWRGSAGAEKYNLERANTPNGPWTVVGADILDDADPFRPFCDLSAVMGQAYYYRMKAKNAAGISPTSNVLGPVTANAMADAMNDFSRMFRHTADLQFDGINAQNLQGDTSRLVRKTATPESIVYQSEKGAMTGFEMDAFFWPNEDIVDFKFYASNDAAAYSEVAPDRKVFAGNWQLVQYSSSALPAKTRYLKIEFRNASANFWTPQISRLTIACRRDKE